MTKARTGVAIRYFRVSQTAKGWFWKWNHMRASVGPFETLPEALADLQHIMGISDGEIYAAVSRQQSPIELTKEEEKIIDQALINSGQKED